MRTNPPKFRSRVASTGSLTSSASDDTWASSLTDRPVERLRGGAQSSAHRPSIERDSVTSSNQDDLSVVLQSASWDPRSWRYLCKWLKRSLLLCAWLGLTYLLMTTMEHERTSKLLTVPPAGADFELPAPPTGDRLGVTLRGPFRREVTDEERFFRSGDGGPANVMRVQVQRVAPGIAEPVDVAEAWEVALGDDEAAFDESHDRKRSHEFHIEDAASTAEDAALQLHLSTNLAQQAVPVQVFWHLHPVPPVLGVCLAAAIVGGLSCLLAFDLVHRTFAAMLASTMAVAVLSVFDMRPAMHTIIAWVDTEVLLLLFAMTIIMAIYSETGLFDYLAVWGYRAFNGHIWPPINVLCLVTALGAALLDNVTIMLMMTPLGMRLCEVMNVHPVPVFVCMIAFANIGTALTPLSDAPTLLANQMPHLVEHGLTIDLFVLHMLPGVLLVAAQTYLQLRFHFRAIRLIQFHDSPEAERLERIILTWRRVARGISAYSKDEKAVRATLYSKVRRMRARLQSLTRVDQPPENFAETLEHLRQKYPIRNKVLLVQATLALTFVLVLNLLHSIPMLGHMSLAWIALMGATLLLLLADIEDMDAILSRVEWCSLLFIACFFILCEGLTRLGLVQAIGDSIVQIVAATRPDDRLAVALVVLVWFSGLTSALTSNVPVTPAMLRVVVLLASNEALGLPLHPLVWAVIFGCCLGGNGSIIGNMANVVSIGVVEQHGYRLTWMEFSKVGLPILLGNLVVATLYLLLAHTVGSWHVEERA